MAETQNDHNSENNNNNDDDDDDISDELLRLVISSCSPSRFFSLCSPEFLTRFPPEFFTRHYRPDVFFSSLPHGWRFNPTDFELITYYLQPKIDNLALPLNLIHEVNVSEYDPEHLAAIYEPAHGGEKWYFFTSREKKYAKGTRPDRKAGHGYWKATGADKIIEKRDPKKTIGYRKALVYYRGKHKEGTKTHWIMHEYRVSGPSRSPQRERNPNDKKTKMRLDDCVLCSIHINEKGKETPSGEQKLAVQAENNDIQPEVNGDVVGNIDMGIIAPATTSDRQISTTDDLLLSICDNSNVVQFCLTDVSPIPLNTVAYTQIGSSTSSATMGHHTNSNPSYDVMNPNYNPKPWLVECSNFGGYSNPKYDDTWLMQNSKYGNYPNPTPMQNGYPNYPTPMQNRYYCDQGFIPYYNPSPTQLIGTSSYSVATTAEFDEDQIYADLNFELDPIEPGILMSATDGAHFVYSSVPPNACPN